MNRGCSNHNRPIGIGLMDVTPHCRCHTALPYESSKKTGIMESLASRDFWKLLSVMSMEVCEGWGVWQSLFVAYPIHQLCFIT